MAVKLPQGVSKKDLTAQFFHKYLWHDKNSGQLIWKPRPVSEFPSESIMKMWNKRFAFKPAGRPSGRPTGGSAMQISLSKSNYLSHRIVALFEGIIATYGDPAEIDHIDGQPLNNRADNLRAVTRSENQRNMKKFKNSTTKCTGVNWSKQKNCWRVEIGAGKRFQRVIEHEKDFFEAVCRRKSLEIDLGYSERHGKGITSPCLDR